MNILDETQCYNKNEGLRLVGGPSLLKKAFTTYSSGVTMQCGII